ncbi:hypothetical protein LCGC14_1589420 [marine sediment metagenome]|uniref:Peptide deformylase n=1 Tax=marine sediment metagenome TaxID=412755 RepID=A0A0F9LEW2_9ZZZZ
MNLMTVLQYPKHEHTLRQISSPYAAGVLPSAELIENMAEYQGTTQGLAAVQLGLPVRLIMVKYGEDYIFMVNPAIVKRSDKMYDANEGCMSIGHGKTRFTISRHKIVKVRYTDLKGNQRSLKARNLDASCLQHEIDHLEGRLIID